VSGDAVVVRDRVVRWVLCGGAVLALLTWHLLGPWPAMILVVLAVVAAAVTYRIEPPRIDLDGTPWLTDPADPAETAEAEAEAEAEDAETRTQPIDQ
jgi:hypothetical protein